MSKEILRGHEARMRVKAGIDKACDAVRPTLGAVGMTAFIEVPGLDPIECDDGVTILRQLDFKDKYENIGLQMLRKAGVRTSVEGGDGTATTTVLTQAILTEAFKELGEDGSRSREIKERLIKGLEEVLAGLDFIKREVAEDDIEKIATIASLDTDVAKLIAEVIKEVGIKGVVTVEKGAQLGYSKEVVKGARFDRGLISPYFVNDHQNMQTVLENPYIILVDRKISTNEQIISLLNSIGTGNDILIIADDVDGVALGTLAQNAVNKVANIACVRNPYTASPARDFLLDMAALTGATIISEERGMRLDKQTKEVCGRAEKVIVTKDRTTIIGATETPDLWDRIKVIQGEIDTTTSEYQKEILGDRLAALTGGIGVIRVGAYTDTEFNAKKYKFENAINATQAALQEGILPGGGVALATVGFSIADPIFRNALMSPFGQMIINAGMSRQSKFEKFFGIRKRIGIDATNGIGIDFKNKKYVNMFEAGIVDPFKVTRLALESAVAITSAVVGMEVAITNEDENSI